MMRPPQIVNKLIRFLALLVACFASTFTPTAIALGSPIGETVYIGYDATVAYDGSQNSSSAYEDATRPPTVDEKHAFGAARTLLGRIADFVAAESSAVGSRALVPYSGQATATSWPGNAGFLGTATKTELPVGTLVDRYGARGGTYVSPVGTPFANRGLPAGHASLPLESYEVVSPFNVKSGPAAPAFGQPGLGIQHELPMSVQELIDLGLLKPR